jgi:hypothetical protein
MEQQPFVDADADNSPSEPEEYGSISALLGERAKPPALGIPGRAPLRVGRFAGALGAFLVAFVEHPGFPLTNLPHARPGRPPRRPRGGPGRPGVLAGAREGTARGAAGAEDA